MKFNNKYDLLKSLNISCETIEIINEIKLNQDFESFLNKEKYNKRNNLNTIFKYLNHTYCNLKLDFKKFLNTVNNIEELEKIKSFLCEIEKLYNFYLIKYKKDKKINISKKLYKILLYYHYNFIYKEK